MPFRSRPSGPASSIAAAAAATIAAVTVAAASLGLPAHAQEAPAAGQPQTNAPPAPQMAAPPAGAPETVAPPAGPVVTPPPVGPATAGQAPAAAAQPPVAQSPDLRPPRRTAQPRAGGSALVVAKVNLRRGPGTENEIVATIPAGNQVRVGECDGEWCAVTWNGHSGFAIARNLNMGGSRQAAGVYPARPGPPGEPGQPAYPYPDVAEGDDVPAYGPGYHYGPPVVYGGPAYYYGPRVYYYGRPWRWHRHWW